jgi:hypothetical protein
VSSDGLISYALVTLIHDRATVSASKDPNKGRNPPRVIVTVSCRSVSLVLSLSEDVQALVQLNLDDRKAARYQQEMGGVASLSPKSKGSMAAER